MSHIATNQSLLYGNRNLESKKRRSSMKKEDMIKLAIVGMMAVAPALSAQGMRQQAPSSSCNGHGNSNGGSTTQPAPKSSCSGKNGSTQPKGSSGGNGTAQPAPQGSCNGSGNKSARGVDNSIHSSYGSSQRTTSTRSFDHKCGAGSCDSSGDDGSTPAPKPQPNPAAQQRSKLKQ